MDILVTGTGGARGWPEPGCGCASCRRAAAHETARMRSTIIVDGVLRLGGDDVASEGDVASGGDAAGGSEDCAAEEEHLAVAGGGADAAAGSRGGAAGGGLRVREIPGGWDVTGADGERLLYPARPGAVPVPPEGARPYDVAFLDMLGDPFQLGGLRARGLVTDDTTVLVAFADHRVPSLAELEERCALWRVGLIGDGGRVKKCRYVKKKVYRVLVIGGARSGKSERAELRVAAEPDVTYVATGPSGEGDPDWAARVAAHRARRPAWWRTAETTDLAGVLAGASGTLLIDGLGTWLAAMLDDGDLDARVAELVAAWRRTSAFVVAVSDETGLGVIPATASGRTFRDWLGRVNQALAAESEEAELVVAGRTLALGG